MGSNIYGGWAEYTCVAMTLVQVLRTKAEGKNLGAVPEMLQTAWGVCSRR